LVTRTPIWSIHLVASSYLHQGFESKSIKGKFAQEIDLPGRQRYVHRSFPDGGAVDARCHCGLNTALRPTQTEKGELSSQSRSSRAEHEGPIDELLAMDAVLVLPVQMLVEPLKAAFYEG